MEFNWLGPDKGIERSLELSSLLYKKLVRDFNNQHESNFQKYFPWMSNQNVGNAFLQDKSIEKDFSLLNFENKYLKAYEKQLIESKEPVLYVQGEPERFRVYNEVLDDIPDSVLFFQRCLNKLEEYTPWMKKLFDNIIKNFIPIIDKTTPNAIISVTSQRSLGSIYLSIPNENIEFRELKNLVAIAHELGHNMFIVYQFGDMVFHKGENTYIYSPVRKTERPAAMALHAAVALFFMVSILKGALDHSESQLSVSEKIYARNSINSFVNELERSFIQLRNCELTDFGKKALKDIEMLALSCKQ